MHTHDSIACMPIKWRLTSWNCICQSCAMALGSNRKSASVQMFLDGMSHLPHLQVVRKSNSCEVPGCSSSVSGKWGDLRSNFMSTMQLPALTNQLTLNLLYFQGFWWE